MNEIDRRLRIAFNNNSLENPLKYHHNRFLNSQTLCNKNRNKYQFVFQLSGEYLDAYSIIKYSIMVDPVLYLLEGFMLIFTHPFGDVVQLDGN